MSVEIRELGVVAQMAAIILTGKFQNKAASVDPQAIAKDAWKLYDEVMLEGKRRHQRPGLLRQGQQGHETP
jgi:hypothetical protein